MPSVFEELPGKALGQIKRFGRYCLNQYRKWYTKQQEKQFLIEREKWIEQVKQQISSKVYYILGGDSELYAFVEVPEYEQQETVVKDATEATHKQAEKVAGAEKKVQNAQNVLNGTGADKVIKEDFPITLNEYILQYRLKQAVEKMSQHPDSPLSQIAEEVGFSDYKYFGKVFKKYFHISPKELKSIGRIV